MTEIMTPQNIIVGAIASSAVQALVWRYWILPRRIAMIRKIAKEEIDRDTDLTRRLVRS